MKIDRIDIYQAYLPYAGGVYRLSGGRTYEGFDATFVRITTDTGLTGWGESTPFGATYIAAHAMGVRAGIAEIAPHLLGLDPRKSDRVYDTMDQALVGHWHAKTALDVACWDIFGQSVGLPVSELLGGGDGVPMPVISSIYAGDPEDMRTRVQQHRAKGYKGHSIKIGASQSEGGPRLDAARIEACLADAAADELFIVDANGGLSVEVALRLLKQLPSHLDFILEAPCRTWQEQKRLSQRCDTPLMIDELAQDDVSVLQMVQDQCADGISLKISKSGGLTQGRRQRDICVAAGATISVQETVGSEVALAALLHLGQTIPKHLLRCVLDTRDMVSLSISPLDAPIKKGGILAPQSPGLGVSPSLEILGEPIQSFH